MLRRENDNSFIKNLHFWLVHLVGHCSNFILCDVLYLSSEKISFLSQTSVKISRKAFYQVVNNDENSSYGTVQYSFCQQKKELRIILARYGDISFELFLQIFEIRMKNQDFFKTTSVYYFVWF